MIGTPAFSASIPTGEETNIAKGPRMAVTLSSWINLVAATTPFWASEPSSAINEFDRTTVDPTGRIEELELKFERVDHL